MKFFKRKKKRHIPFNRLTVPSLIRNAIYDSMLMPPERIAVSLGLPPISEEVSEMEERASDERIHRIHGILPFIDSHSEIAAKITATAYLLEGENMSEVSLEEIDQMTDLFKLVALSATTSCISTLVDLDLLECKVEHEHDHE